MLSKLKIKDLERQGYRMVGNHSSIKVCLWCKKSLRDEDFCYKEKFYGIKSHRCVQMTPVFICNQRCQFCWRDIDFTPTKFSGKVDDPKFIVDESIKQQREYLQGFKGSKKVNMKKFNESLNPNQFAISLSGEPTFYPKLDGLIKEIKSRGYTAFLVSNGTNPEMLNKLIKNKAMPTQMYITLPSPNEEIYNNVCNPLNESNWKNILKSLKLLNKFDRSTIRLTLVKNLNMLNIKEYAELINIAKPEFVECKAYVNVGFSKERLKIENMPRHNEIKEFTKKLNKLINYKVKDEKIESRVILLQRNNSSINSRIDN